MDWAGMHAVFGGFLLAVAMPRERLAQGLKAKLEPLTVVLLLPIFFTYSGLNTKLDMIASPALLGVTPVLLAASILDKFGTCWAAARLTGQDNPTALGIGALMNARNFDGADHPQDRPSERHHRDRIFLNDGTDGGGDHPDGLAFVRARVWPQGASPR